MICRRCGKDIMDGSENCPVCGISQHTYITPRDYNAITTAPTKKTRRGTVISIIAVVVALASVVGMYLIAGQNSEDLDYQKVLDAYEERDVTKCGLALGSFIRKHPNSEYKDEAEELFTRLNSAVIWLEENDIDPTSEKINSVLTAIDATDEDRLAQYRREEQELVDQLKRTARSEILKVESLELQEPLMGNLYNVAIEWRNMSQRDIKEILFRVEAYDAAGSPVNASAGGKSEVALTESKFIIPNGGSGAPYSSFWMNVWQNDGQVDHIRITGVKITYMEGGTLSLPPEVCEVIVG